MPHVATENTKPPLVSSVKEHLGGREKQTFERTRYPAAHLLAPCTLQLTTPGTRRLDSVLSIHFLSLESVTLDCCPPQLQHAAAGTCSKQFNDTYRPTLEIVFNQNIFHKPTHYSIQLQDNLMSKIIHDYSQTSSKF